MFYRVYIAALKSDHFHIGDGWRTVYASEGRKWVYMIEPFTLNVDKITVKRWRDMRPTERATPKRLRRIVKRYAETMGKHLITSRVKEMLQYAKDNPA